MTNSLEDRARRVLGLEQADPALAYLSMRVENLWRAEGFAPVVPFNGAIFLPLGAGVDTQILQAALLAVIRRHDVLHSRLAIGPDGRPILAVDEPHAPDLDIAAVTRAQIAAYREGGESSPITEFVETPLDLVQGSGLRCRLFRDEDGNITLGILLHHYFGDGWSSQILRREIFESFQALREGRTPEFAETVQYADYARAQRQSLSANLTAPLEYWRQRLEAAPHHKLPYDHVRQTGQMGRLYFGLDAQVTSHLSEVARAQNVSLFAVYLTAFQLLLARWCESGKAITAVNTADRIKPQFLNTVGYLIASLPVLVEIDDDAPLSDLFVTVAKTFYDGYGRRDLSYDLYDAIVQPPQPFCTTLFNFIPLQDKLSATASQQTAPPTDIVSGPPITRVRVHREIYFCLVQQPGGMVGKVYYNMDFFTEATIRALIARFGGLLEKMVADPKGLVGAVR